MRIYPYTFYPIYKERIWGGRNLERLFRRTLPAGKKIGESWELADLPGDSSVLANGPDAGTTLNEMVAALGQDLLGATLKRSSLEVATWPGGSFPLLLKLLDAEDSLSLQVHPDRAAAAEIPGAVYKTECWYIVASRGGVIYKGVHPGVTAERFRAAVKTDTVQDVVRKIPVSPGEFHYLPAGLVHALGAGVVVAEVQTPSDTTFRVTDWGRGRDIHVEQSMRCIRFGLTGEPAPGARRETLIATEFFTVKKRSVESLGAAKLPANRCTAIMVLQTAGQAEIRHSGPVEDVVPISAGQTLLIPAALGDCAVTVRGAASWLEITLPEGP